MRSKGAYAENLTSSDSSVVPVTSTVRLSTCAAGIRNGGREAVIENAVTSLKERSGSMVRSRNPRWTATPSRGVAIVSILGLIGFSLGVCTGSVVAQEDRNTESRNAQATAVAPKKITTVEGISEYRLDNGLQVLLFPDESKPTVTVNITYLVGSRHEGRGEAGMAHLLEHMAFKGTPTYDNIWGVLEDHGASFNGTTWVDRTNYFETLPASDENLEFALHLEADRMVNSKISAEDLAGEMTVVRNEFEIGESDPVGILSERMLSAAYLWHNYGKSTIGNRSDIERVPVENLRRFYERYYQPDNAMLVVAGKFDADRALELVTKHFGAIPKPKRVLDKTYTEEPAQDGPRFVTLKRVGDVAAAGLVYHIPAGSHADFPAVQILEDVLTSEPSGRLYKALVETGMASSVYGSTFSWAEPGVMQILAEARLDQDTQQVLDKMREIVEGVATAGISDEEVERIKTRRLKNIKLAMTNSGRIGVQLSNWAALGDWRMFFVHRDRIKKVTTADVQGAARKYLVESNRTAGLFTPTKEPVRATIPPKPDVTAIVKDYKGSETIEKGEAFVATPDNIEARTRRISLQPGVKAALLPKETRGDAVRARFRFHFGTEEQLTGHTTALELIPTLLLRGTTEHDYQQLRDEIDRLQSRIDVVGGVGTISASIQSDRAHIIPAIELLGEILQKPAFAPDHFEIVTKERLTKLEEGLSDPQARGFTALGRAMNPWPAESIHYVPTIEEQIERLKSLSLGTIKDVYSRFCGGSNFEVSVVGDFDESEVTTALKNLFGSWKSPSPYKRIAKPHRRIEAKSETILTPDKEMAVVGTGAVLEMRDDDWDYPAMEFASYVLGESAKSRLINRLRHKDGLSYGAGSFLRVDSRDRRASVVGYAMCAPQNAVKAQDAMREEFQKLIAEGVTDEELAEGRKSYALKFENSLANDRVVVGELVNGLEIDRTFRYHVDLLEKIQALTKADIQRVLTKYLADAPFAEMKAGDLEKKSEEATP
jgi:zinc protease